MKKACETLASARRDGATIVGTLTTGALMQDRDAPSDSREPEAQKSPTPHTEDRDALPAVLTVEELAAYLRVNRKTIYQAIAAGELPGARHIGGTIRICRDAVLTWLSGEGRVSSSRSKP